MAKDEARSWCDHNLALLIAESNQFIYVSEYSSSLEISSTQTFGTYKGGQKNSQPETMLLAHKGSHKIYKICYFTCKHGISKSNFELFSFKNKTNMKINIANENTLSTVHNITLLLIQVSGYTTKLKIT